MLGAYVKNNTSVIGMHTIGAHKVKEILIALQHNYTIGYRIIK